VPIPFLLRLAVAVPLILWWRPWSRALAAVVATPAFYWWSFLMLIAPIAVAVRRLEAPLPDEPWSIACRRLRRLG